MAEKVIAAISLACLLIDTVLILICSAIHFMRGLHSNGIYHGAITLSIYCLAGIITNIFHFVRHELSRMAQRSEGKKIKTILLIFIPNYYLVFWSVKRFILSESLTVKCWTASLRIFYCSTGSLTQAVFQGYLVVRLWWEEGVSNVDYIIVIVTAVYLCLYAIYGVCRYVWVQYYDETGSYLPAKHIILITFTLTLNMSGRVAAMSVVMGTLGWYWLLFAIISPFLVNLAVYTYTAVQRGSHSTRCFENTCRYINLVPLALLSSMTVSDKRSLTVLTTFAWMGSYFPQILKNHTTKYQWLVWSIPTVAQIAALVIMMLQWEVFKVAFYRFSRVVRQPSGWQLQRKPDRNERAELKS